MLLFGVVGYIFKKLNYPLAPLVLALVLGDKAETAFRQAMLVSGASVGTSCGRTSWSGDITLLALILLFWPLISKVIRMVRPAPVDNLAARTAGRLTHSTGRLLPQPPLPQFLSAALAYYWRVVR